MDRELIRKKLHKGLAEFLSLVATAHAEIEDVEYENMHEAIQIADATMCLFFPEKEPSLSELEKHAETLTEHYGNMVQIIMAKREEEFQR